MNIIELGNSSLPSTINDPFKVNKITSINVKFEDFWGRGDWKAVGYVYFKNGNTEGNQTFKGDTFDEVVVKIKSFIKELK